MGRYKRSKSKVRIRPHIIHVDDVPERFQRIVPTVNNVLYKFCKEKRLSIYRVIGPRLNESVFLFEFEFPFWKQKPCQIKLFVSKRENECGITQTKHRLDFEVLISDAVHEDVVYECFNSHFHIVESGLLLEQKVVKDLTDFYRTSGQPYHVRKSTVEEDWKQKIDIIVYGFERSPFGVQLKKNVKEWIPHRHKHPEVPSILLDTKTPIQFLSQAVEQIASSLKLGRIEHIDLLHKKPPT